MTDRNTTAAQAVARWLIEHIGVNGTHARAGHIADALGVGSVQSRNYLNGQRSMTENRLVMACDRYGLRIQYDSATGWTVEEVSDADRS